MNNQELNEIKLRVKQFVVPKIGNGWSACPKCKGHPEDYATPTRGGHYGTVCGGCQGMGVVEHKIPAPQVMQLLKDTVWLISQLEQANQQYQDATGYKNE